MNCPNLLAGNMCNYLIRPETGETVRHSCSHDDHPLIPSHTYTVWGGTWTHACMIPDSYVWTPLTTVDVQPSKTCPPRLRGNQSDDVPLKQAQEKELNKQWNGQTLPPPPSPIHKSIPWTCGRALQPSWTFEAVRCRSAVKDTT